MNTNNHNRHNEAGVARDDAFDRAMRELHRQALDRVSARTQATLRAARTATVATGRVPATGFGWRAINRAESKWAEFKRPEAHWLWAGGFAAMFALAIGLQLSGPVASVGSPRSAVTDAAVGAGQSKDTAFATLDENPDFYLWLGAGEADPMLDPSSEDCCDEPS